MQCGCKITNINVSERVNNMSVTMPYESVTTGTKKFPKKSFLTRLKPHKIVLFKHDGLAIKNIVKGS